MEEINDWIPVKGFEGLYEVSGILGKVRSLSYHRTGMVEIMKGKHRKNGYVDIVLSKNGKKGTFREHRIVAEHFCSNPLNKLEVNHINEIKDDNRACNLEWVTRKENDNYGTRNKRMAEALRNHVKKSKPVIQLTLDGEFVREWPSAHECGRNGFKRSNISACCRGEKPQYKGYLWKYKDEND